MNATELQQLTPIEDIETIRSLALAGERVIFVRANGQEAVILAGKLGLEWWQNPKLSAHDLLRIVVY